MLWYKWRPAGIGEDYLNDAVSKSSFNTMATSAYMLLFYFEVQSPFLASSSLASLADSGRSSFFRRISWEIHQNESSPLYATCELPLNLVFQVACTAIHCWHTISRIFLTVAQARVVWYRISSASRASRLSALLRDLDERQINELAQDANTFFKIDSYADEIELKQSRRPNALPPAGN